MEPRYKLKTAPTFDPVTITELKRNLRIGAQEEDDNSQDVYLQEILSAVISDVQEIIGRQLTRATYTGYLDEFPTDDLLITLGPVDTISSIKYYNSAGVLTTMSADDYQLDNIDLTGRIRFLETYTLEADKMNAIEIEFTTGWSLAEGSQAEAVPKAIKDAIILRASDRYLNPENAAESLRMKASDRLLRYYRVQRY